MVGIMNHVPLVGSVYGFSKTAMKVHNATSTVGACKEVIKGAIVHCIPQNFKYTIFYFSLAVSGAVYVVTGFNPLAVSVFVNNPRLILET